jgi:hypothetical protein
MNGNCPGTTESKTMPDHEQQELAEAGSQLGHDDSIGFADELLDAILADVARLRCEVPFEGDFGDDIPFLAA